LSRFIRNSVAGLAVAIALTATAVAAAPGSLVIQADHRIAGYAVKRDGTLGGAIERFGTPSRYRRDRASGWNGCVVTWRRYGLQIFFYNLGGNDSCRPETGFFRDAIMTGRSWRTASGLRIGHPTSFIRRYHPRARHDPRARNWWWLVTRTFPYGEGGEYAALTAKVRNGRVAAFAVYHQAGGE
jgi:hypothetical protein